MLLNPAIKEFLGGYFSTHRRTAKTIAAYTTDLRQFEAFAGTDLELTAVKAMTIERWAAQLRIENYSPSSIRRKIAALKVFCSYWLRKEVLAESPFWRVKLSFGRIEQLPRTLTENEMRALLTEAQRKSRADPNQRNKKDVQESLGLYRTLRNLAIIELLFATGIRVGEASALDLDDFSPEECRFGIKGKGGLHRLAFVVDEHAVRVLREYFSLRKTLETCATALFLNPKKTRLSTQGIANVVSKLRCQARIERPVTPHMLRHTSATMLLRNGADIRVVQEFLGHASIATTQRYTHIAKEHLVNVLQECHPSRRIRVGNYSLPFAV